MKMVDMATNFDQKWGYLLKYLSFLGVVALLFLGRIFVQKDEYKEDQTALRPLPAALDATNFRVTLLEEFRAEQRALNSKYGDQQVAILQAIAEVNRQLAVQNTINSINGSRLERIELKQDRAILSTTNDH